MSPVPMVRYIYTHRYSLYWQCSFCGMLRTCVCGRGAVIKLTPWETHTWI